MIQIPFDGKTPNWSGTVLRLFNWLIFRPLFIARKPWKFLMRRSSAIEEDTPDAKPKSRYSKNKKAPMKKVASGVWVMPAPVAPPAQKCSIKSLGDFCSKQYRHYQGLYLQYQILINELETTVTQLDDSKDQLVDVKIQRDNHKQGHKTATTTTWWNSRFISTLVITRKEEDE